MLRLVTFLAALLVLSGCKSPGNSGAPADPFFGRTRVAPPRTGAIAGQPATDPYYPQSPQANPLRTPSWPLRPPAATSPTAPGILPQQPAMSPNWVPAQGRTEPAVQPAMPQTGGVSQPLGESGSPTRSGGTAGGALTTGPGDLLTVPAAARSPVETSATVAGSGTDGRAAPSAATSDVGSRGLSGPAAGTATARYPGTTPVYAGRTDGSLYGRNVASSLSGRERIVRTIGPRPQASADFLLRDAPRPIDAVSSNQPPPASPRLRGPVNIADLPE